MNQTEARFIRDYLTPMSIPEETTYIREYRFEAVKFLVGTDKCWYTPDFQIVWSDGQIEYVDVKGGGGWEDDSLVKIKAVAAQFPFFHWTGWTFKQKTWTARRFNDRGDHPCREVVSVSSY